MLPSKSKLLLISTLLTLSGCGGGGGGGEKSTTGLGGSAPSGQVESKTYGSALKLHEQTHGIANISSSMGVTNHLVTTDHKAFSWGKNWYGGLWNGQGYYYQCNGCISSPSITPSPSNAYVLNNLAASKSSTVTDMLTRMYGSDFGFAILSNGEMYFSGEYYDPISRRDVAKIYKIPGSFKRFINTAFALGSDNYIYALDFTNSDITAKKSSNSPIKSYSDDLYEAGDGSGLKTINGNISMPPPPGKIVRSSAFGSAAAVILQGGDLYIYGTPDSYFPNCYQDLNQTQSTCIKPGQWVKIGSNFASFSTRKSGELVYLHQEYENGPIEFRNSEAITNITRAFSDGWSSSSPYRKEIITYGNNPEPTTVITKDAFPRGVFLRGDGSLVLIDFEGEKAGLCNPIMGGVPEGSSRTRLDYCSMTFNSPHIPPSYSESDTDIDALHFEEVNYEFTCQPSQEKHSTKISNGPCADYERAYSKAKICNEIETTPNPEDIKNPFFQCLSEKSTGRYKSYYKGYLQ